jgi:hypothetical protein
VTDFELLSLYGECHRKAYDLGLKLDANNNQIHIKNGEEIICSKMKITQIEMFLEGYESGLKNDVLRP